MAESPDRVKFKEDNGISISSARNRLMRSIIFALLKELNHHFCYRCEKELTVSDYTMEHIVPWAYKKNSYELYMDLSNVAFSHLGCNSSYARKYTERALADYKRRKGANLTSTDLKKKRRRCSSCKKWRKFKFFSIRRADKVAGLKYRCKDCLSRDGKAFRAAKKKLTST